MRGIRSSRQRHWGLLGLVATLAAGLLLSPATAGARGGAHRGIHKIKHVVIIMQENRSFDSYFGTYPRADGIPLGHVCVPDPVAGYCISPYHDVNDRNLGGPHGAASSFADVNGGAMNGFVTQAEKAQGCTTGGTIQCQTDVMGYHTAREIPNYWKYARRYVLQDRMFEPNASWSLPQHLFLLSEWSANCTYPDAPFSCTNNLDSPGFQDTDPTHPLIGPQPNFSWTDMTYLLHRAGVSWGYYIRQGLEPDCPTGAARCPNVAFQSRATPGIWNPLPDFTTVRENRELSNIQDTSAFMDAAKSGNLPAVSWVIPNQQVSEHPPAPVSSGMHYVSGLINSVMKGPDWKSTAIFLSWDDWGGFYDHVPPPVIDGNGFGMRVPGLVISPFAKTNFIDHQTLSHDAYNKFIEDVFLNGTRLNPQTDGRPDPRPYVRELNPLLGDLAKDFNFRRKPSKKKLILR